MPYEVEFNEELETLKLEKKSLQEQNDLLKELVKASDYHLSYEHLRISISVEHSRSMRGF